MILACIQPRCYAKPIFGGELVPRLRLCGLLLCKQSKTDSYTHQ
jgi:hypothetical protein